ncbi:MAG: transposase [Methylococcales bacterium]|nr:transposase [Methylococcales bacterium]
MNLTQLFCDLDDFCQAFVPAWQKSLLSQGEKKRNRLYLMSISEMIAILVAYHQKGYRTFKGFYRQPVQKYWRPEFPNLLSYHRFIELLPEVTVPVTAFMKSRSAASQGIAFIDSTSLCVGKNIRLPRHRTFAEAGRGKSSTGWCYTNPNNFLCY